MIECVTRENSNFVNFNYVDVAIANQGKVHTCSQCSDTYNRQVSICPTCHLDANYLPRDFDPYYRTESRHPTEKPLVNVGEPCMVNPNSLGNDLASAFQKDCAKEERFKHHKLVSLYSEVKESLTLQHALILVEPADGEVIFESDDCILLDIAFQIIENTFGYGAFTKNS